MHLTCFLDESGTHGANVSVMAGFLADERQWRKFEKRTRKLFYRYKVDVFHCIDVKRGDKDFAGWTVNRKIEFLDEFHHIINETVECGFAAILREEDFQYYQGLTWPAKARRDSRYALLFRGCMASAIDAVLSVNRWRFGPEPRLCIVLENGHKNAPDVARIYDFFKGRLGANANRSLANLTFESKQSCLPVAAADLFAYSVFGQETGAKPIGIPNKPNKSDASYPGNLYRIPLIRDTLDSLHEQGLKIVSGDFPSS